jgi:hypothetical protein
METRRELLRVLALGTAAASLPASLATPGVAEAAPVAGSEGEQARRAVPDEGIAAPAPWWLFAPLQAGSALGAGWSLGSLSEVRRGACVLELVHESGDVARVHVCGHDGRPKGLAHGHMVDLVLMDGGNGDKPTDEQLGRVLLGIAVRVRLNEGSPEGDLAPLAAMMSHPDRVARYGAHSLK